MFKTQFNSLYAAVMDFVLDENIDHTFDSPESEIKFYKNIVDEYNIISFNLENIKSKLDSDSELYEDTINIITLLSESFEKYKTKSASVRAYLYELETSEVKNNFFNTLYRYEQSLISLPLIKIDVNEIQNVLSYAKIYTDNTNNYYYYANNPFEVDDELNIIVPEKQSFETAKQLQTSVYNYMYGLYNTYIEINSEELSTMNNLESSIENKIYEYNEIYNNAKNNKIYVKSETTPEDFYNAVEELKIILEEKNDEIINNGVYRFTRLTTLFETLSENISSFISDYESNDLYLTYKNEVLFDSKIKKLSEYICFIEDGVIKVDIDYIITDISLKELVEEIIELSKIVKKKLIYTQKYHESGNPKTLEFEFYQTELFLSSIKSYYYELMSENIYRYSNIGIDNFGNDSVNSIREIFKDELSKYNKYISKETNYLNNFEFEEYYQNVINIQNKLKKSALIFVEGATKTSPSTYIVEIEKYYLTLLKKLDQDLIDIRNKRSDDILEKIDENKVDSYKRLSSFNTHVNNIENVLLISEKYIFLGMYDYINEYLYQPINLFLDQLKDNYSKEKYLTVIKDYNDFYLNNIINFNLLYAFETISESVNMIFSKIDIIDDMYIEEFTNDSSSENYIECFLYLEDLFGDDTYKVLRNELFSKLDVIYDFVISTKPNEKSFLTNEKNLKKIYFDNQLMKINYIRWYHKILVELDKYRQFDENVLGTIDLYMEKKDFIENFTHKSKLNTLIVILNKELAEIKNNIKNYSIDSEYSNIVFSNDIIKTVDLYNRSVIEDFNKYKDIIDKLERLTLIAEIDEKKLKIEKEHKEQWVEIIENNTIAVAEKVSYNDMDVFTGSIPYTVELSAKLETSLDSTDDEINATYKWYIGSTIKEGIQITHTFYEEGNYTIRCEITYHSGESFSRYLEFDLTGPQNSQIVKSGTVKYAPLSSHPEQPKITYIDPESGEYITVPLYTDGDITSMIKDGNIVCEKAQDDLFEEKIGLVILGFTGEEFVGFEYDYSQIFEEDIFEFPDIYEFLFDFKISTPLSGNITIDIQDSKYTTFMAKIPDAIESVYEIGSASEFISAGTSLKVTIGDKILLKNHYESEKYTSERYAVLEIKNIRTFVEPEQTAEDGISKYYYEVEIDYFVNTALNQYEQDEFKPEETSLVAPTIVFKTNVRELFNSLVLRLEEINALREKIDNGDLDKESYESTLADIEELEEKNKAFYLFEELDKIKSKYFSLNSIYKKLIEKYRIDTSLPLNEMDEYINLYKNHIEKTKSFKEYMYDIDAYDFRKNIIDLGILVKLYKDQQTVLEILIKTYEYKRYDITYYKNKLSDIKMFDTSSFLDEEMSYSDALVKLVLKLRELLFRLKIVINYPIMTDGNYVIMTSLFYRWNKDLITEEWNYLTETDLFLLNKKLELRYGYEIGKKESGLTYKDFISTLVDIEKDFFGRGLSNGDIKDLSNYIQTIETKTIEEYDDFFMIPFWIDYLEKNV